MFNCIIVCICVLICCCLYPGISVFCFGLLHVFMFSQFYVCASACLIFSLPAGLLICLPDFVVAYLRLFVVCMYVCMFRFVCIFGFLYIRPYVCSSVSFLSVCVIVCLCVRLYVCLHLFFQFAYVCCFVILIVVLDCCMCAFLFVLFVGIDVFGSLFD